MKVNLDYVVARLNSIKIETSDEYTRKRIEELIEEIKKGIAKGSKIRISLYYDKYELLDALVDTIFDELCEEEFDEEQCYDIAVLISEDEWRKIYDKIWRLKGKEIRNVAYSAFEEDVFDAVVEKLMKRKSLYNEIKEVVKSELMKRIK